MLLPILFGFISFILLLVIVGLVSAKTVYVQQTAILSTNSTTAFDSVADFQQFVKWNAWSAKDPNMQQTFSGTPKTIGHAYQWSGNKNVGIGSMEILDIKEDLGIEMALNFGPRGGSKCGFDFEALAENQTKITWWFKSEVGSNPFRRVFGLMMERFITKDFGQGLKNLKHYLNA